MYFAGVFLLDWLLLFYFELFFWCVSVGRGGLMTDKRGWIAKTTIDENAQNKEGNGKV